MTAPLPSVRAIVERLGLQPHPEGGYYREVHRAPLLVEHRGLIDKPVRSAGTSIYFLLPGGTFSAWHRVAASDETWHFYGGGPLELHTIAPEGDYTMRPISGDLAHHEPQFTVPAGWWQAARPAADAEWSLCGCTVVPGFDFADFSMPPLAELLDLFPQHAAILRELTRG